MTEIFFFSNCRVGKYSKPPGGHVLNAKKKFDVAECAEYFYKTVVDRISSPQLPGESKVQIGKPKKMYLRVGSSIKLEIPTTKQPRDIKIKKQY